MREKLLRLVTILVATVGICPADAGEPVSPHLPGASCSSIRQMLDQWIDAAHRSYTVLGSSPTFPDDAKTACPWWAARDWLLTAEDRVPSKAAVQGGRLSGRAAIAVQVETEPKVFEAAIGAATAGKPVVGCVVSDITALPDLAPERLEALGDPTKPLVERGGKTVLRTFGSTTTGLLLPEIRRLAEDNTLQLDVNLTRREVGRLGKIYRSLPAGPARALHEAAAEAFEAFAAGRACASDPPHPTPAP